MPPVQSNLTHSLRNKIIGALIAQTIFTSLTFIFLSSILPFWLITVINLFTAVIIINLVWFLLNPLKNLLNGAIEYSNGQFDHRINIRSGDELETVAQTLNQMAVNLSKNIAELTNDKHLVTSEKNKLEAVISSIADGIIVLDLHKNILMANQPIETLTGYKLIEMVGKNIDTLFYLTDDKLMKYTSKDYCSFEQPSPIPTNTLHLIGKNNHKSDVRMISSSIKGPIQADLGCVLTIRDVNKEKQFTEMQIDFVSMASHELRTPITSIQGYLNTIMQEAKLENIHKQFLERAIASTKQLAELVDTLLSVSKVERNAMTISKTSLKMDELLKQVVEENHYSAVQKNTILTLELPPIPLPQVTADRIRIIEVLNNLISNAIKYGKQNGKVLIKAEIKNGNLQISITDDGPGIPKDAIPHLFTKFFRVTGSLDQMSKGTGLGLYISKSIIELHHGKIGVDSTVGQGTTFYFTLPINKISQPTIADLHKLDQILTPRAQAG